jgi:hypothetical protein
MPQTTDARASVEALLRAQAVCTAAAKKTGTRLRKVADVVGCCQLGIFGRRA